MAEFLDVHACDRFASDPDDPGRWDQGVADADLVPGPAVRFCRDAVASHEDTLRFQHQLARALWAAKAFEEGTALFEQLVTRGKYEPSLSYLADAYEFGIGTAADKSQAQALRASAAQAGLNGGGQARAAVFLGQQTASAAPVTAQPATKFDPRHYSQPKIITALEAGNLAQLKSVDLGSMSLMGSRAEGKTVYLSQFGWGFEGTQAKRDPSCVQLYKPAITARIEQDFYLQQAQRNNPQTGQGLMNLMQGVIDLTEQLEQDGGSGIIVDTTRMERLKKEGFNDAEKLIAAHGCDSEVVQRIYTNLAAYVLGGRPALSAKEQARQAEETRKRAERQEKHRINQLKAKARKSCNKRFAYHTFCSCLTNGMSELSFKAEDWGKLMNDFSRFASVAVSYDGAIELVRSCRKGG